MADTIEIRRRRAAYRAHHRGTKEMDWLLSRYADVHLADMVDPDLAVFEAFLQLPDPEIQNWIMGSGDVTDDRFVDLVGALKSFHGLSGKDH